MILAMKNAQECKLWKGSTLELAFEHKYLTLAMVQDKIAAYKRCDDLTPGEVKLLAALEEDVR